jgi:hypothetical protein
MLGSYIGLLEKYQGDCLFIPWYSGTMSDWERDQFIYQTTIGTIFAVAFLAVGAGFALLARPSARLHAIAAGILLAAVAYVGIATVTWYRNPIPRESDEELTRLYFSAYWPIGWLQRTDNYSVLCGQ